MGLFGPSPISKEIFERVKVELEGIKGNIGMFEGNNGYDSMVAAVFMGYFAYNIAGVQKAKSARQVIDLYCTECVAPSEDAGTRAAIQEFYYRAKRMSDMLMSYGDGLTEIIEAHAESICALNGWADSQKNKSAISTILQNFYLYLSRL